MTVKAQAGPGAEVARRDDILVNPATGQATPLDAPATDLANALGELEGLFDTLTDYRRGIEAELVRRLDRRGERKGIIDGVELETNAPTEDVYDVDRLRVALWPLVERGTIDTLLVQRLIRYPEPKPPEPVVDRREVNKLKASDNRELLGAIAAARQRRPTRRRLKVLGIIRTAHATEEHQP